MNAAHQRFPTLLLKHSVTWCLTNTGWGCLELSLVIPRRMVPVLWSSTLLFSMEGNWLLLTRLYNCVCVQKHLISWSPSIDRESLWDWAMYNHGVGGLYKPCTSVWPDSLQHKSKLLKGTNQSICFKLELMLACAWSWVMWLPLIYGELPVDSSCLMRPCLRR